MLLLIELYNKQYYSNDCSSFLCVLSCIPSRLGSHDNIVDCHAMDDRTAQAVILLDFCDGGDMHPIASSADPTSDLDKIRQVKDRNKIDTVVDYYSLEL